MVHLITPLSPPLQTDQQSPKTAHICCLFHLESTDGCESWATTAGYVGCMYIHAFIHTLYYKESFQFYLLFLRKSSPIQQSGHYNLCEKWLVTYYVYVASILVHAMRYPISIVIAHI